MGTNKSMAGWSAMRRFAMWMLPQHRKEWGEAMLNEAEYISSRTAAWHWILGCTLAAVQERMVFELGRTFMSRRIFKLALGVGAAVLFIAIGTYIDAKPYQRERIWIAVRDAIHPGDAPRPERSRGALSSEAAEQASPRGN